ncbi:MAG: VWA domain-containing protein [Candidatus Binataceae bacterium]
MSDTRGNCTTLTGSYTAVICGSIAFAFVLAASGCSNTQSRASAPAAVAPLAAAPAPNPCADPGEPDAAISSQPGYTQLGATVIDQAGKPIHGLKRTDFVVSSGAQALPIEYFRDDTRLAPVSIILVIDTSDSMRTKLDLARDGLVGLLLPTTFGCEEVTVFEFGDTPNLVQGFTTDRGQVIEKIFGLATIGGTAMYDAIGAASNYARTNARYSDRAIVVLTDRVDDRSKATIAATLAKVRDSGARLYLIAIGDSNAEPREPARIGPLVFGSHDIDRVDAESLDKFAAAADGEAFIVKTIGFDYRGTASDLDEAIIKIKRQLGRDYEIGVLLPPNGSTPAMLPSVAVQNHPGAIASAYLQRPSALR